MKTKISSANRLDEPIEPRRREKQGSHAERSSGGPAKRAERNAAHGLKARAARARDCEPRGHEKVWAGRHDRKRP